MNKTAHFASGMLSEIHVSALSQDGVGHDRVFI